MAENQTKPTKESVTAFINKIADPGRAADARALVTLLQRVTGEKPVMWGPAIIGFGSYHYAYDTGREGDTPLVGFSPRKTASMLYLQKDFTGAKPLLDKLGQKSKGCIAIKRLSGVDQKALEQLLARSVAHTRKKYPRGD